MIVLLLFAAAIYLAFGLFFAVAILVDELDPPFERLGFCRRAARFAWHAVSWPLQFWRGALGILDRD